MKFKNFRKSLYGIALCMTFALCLFGTGIISYAADTGWKQDSKGWWYVYDEEGNYYKDGVWYIGDKYYYFDEQGYMLTGWITDNGTTYYANKDGSLKTGWYQEGNDWYYFAPHMVIGEFVEGGYYIGDDGKMASNKVGYDYDENVYYYIGTDGKADTTSGWKKTTPYYDSDSVYTTYVTKEGTIPNGWYEISGKWYYFEWGYMYQNEMVYVDGNPYYFKPDGTLATGWYDHRTTENYSVWTYSSPSGILWNGWAQSGGKWYYCEEGVPYTGAKEVDGTSYIFTRSGELVYGFYAETEYNWDGTAFDVLIYTDPKTGETVTGWAQVGKDTYYVINGYVVMDRYQEIDGESYYFDDAGKLIYGWYEDVYYYGDSVERNWIYTNPSTGAEYTGWVQSGKDWYYVEDSYLCKDFTRSIDDVIYHFDEEGKLITGWYKLVEYDYNGTAYEEWIYTNPSTGAEYTGWVQSGKDWYYFDQSRMYKDGIYDVGTEEYAFDEEGKLRYGWFKVVEKYFAESYEYWMYTNPVTGALYSGWLQSGSDWYYLMDGYMINDTEEYIDDVWYVFKPDGTLVRGYYEREFLNGDGTTHTERMYRDPVSGKPYTGWVKLGTDWYFAENSYIENSGTLIVDELDEYGNFVNEPSYEDYRTYVEYGNAMINWLKTNTYVFNVGGALSKGGWTTINDGYNTWDYYANADGTVYHGWIEKNGKHYYFYLGELLKNCLTPDGYYVDVNGVWVK